MDRGELQRSPSGRWSRNRPLGRCAHRGLHSYCELSCRCIIVAEHGGSYGPADLRLDTVAFQMGSLISGLDHRKDLGCDYRGARPILCTADGRWR